MPSAKPNGSTPSRCSVSSQRTSKACGHGGPVFAATKASKASGRA
jgi:hypothetical protein